MRKQNIFDLYNEQHKDDVKAADKMPGEVTPADVDPEPEQKAAPEQKPEKEPEQKAEPEQKPEKEPEKEPEQKQEQKEGDKDA